MMKSMIAENGLTFKELEKNIYSWICQIGRERICISGYGVSGGLEGSIRGDGRKLLVMAGY